MFHVVVFFFRFFQRPSLAPFYFILLKETRKKAYAAFPCKHRDFAVFTELVKISVVTGIAT